jgi:hypothetical protein
VKKLLALLFTLASLSEVIGQPLVVHPTNQHYFSYKGKPLILVGSGEHYGAVINKGFNYQIYLEALKQDGLNTTRLFTGAYVERLGDFGIAKNTLAPGAEDMLLPWKRSDVPGYALGGNKFDLSQWDEHFFDRLKNFIQQASYTNVIVEVVLFSAHYDGGWNYSALNGKNNINMTDSLSGRKANTLNNGNILSHQEKYVRKIVRELNTFDNIYYEIQNEPWGDQIDTVFIANAYGPADDWKSMMQVVSEASNAWQRKVAGWIKDEESKLPKKHLIAQNISNFRYPITNADPNISVFNFHYAFPAAVHENYHLNKVIGFNETGFAGRLDATYRRQAWRFLMAGGALFNQLDYSFSVGSENGQDTTYKAPGGGSPALRKQLGVMKRFFSQLDFINLKPDLATVVAAPGASTLTLSDGRQVWVIYVETIAKKTYDIKANIPKGNYEVIWTDAVTGKMLLKGSTDGTLIKSPPTLSDKVAIVRSLQK